MSHIEGMIYCDGCGVEFSWSPIISGEYNYCCQDCLEGRQCGCGERLEMEENRRAGGEDQVAAPGTY